MQAEAAQVEQVKAALQKACAELSAWEQRVLHARDLRSLAAITSTEGSWALSNSQTDVALEPWGGPLGGSLSAPAAKWPSGASGVATTTRQQSRCSCPVESRSDALALLDTLQEDALQAAGTVLVPRGRLVYSPVLCSVIQRPEGAKLVPEAQGWHRKKPVCVVKPPVLAKGHKALETLPRFASRIRPHSKQWGATTKAFMSRSQAPQRTGSMAAQSGFSSRRQTASSRVLPSLAKYLPAWQNVSKLL
jgi:hypothetical protein